MSISVGDKVYNHETNESLEIVQLVGDIRDTHYKLSDDSVISIIDFITKPIYLIKGTSKCLKSSTNVMHC